MLLEMDTTGKLIGAAIEVHRVLGPGLLESVYEECLCRELAVQGVPFQKQVALPIDYKGTRLSSECRMDLLVNDSVVAEVKAVEKLLPIHEAQLMTYLRLSGKRIGLLLNFNVPVLKDGIVRRVL